MEYKSNKDAINNNPLYNIIEDTLIIRDNKYPFDTNIILGKIKNEHFSSWLQGTEVPDIYIKYIESIQTSNRIIYIDSGKCNTLQLELTEPIMKLPESINTLIMYLILENIRHENIITESLVRTYGSFLIRDDDCNKKVKNKLNIKPTKNRLNTLLFQENVHGKYITLSEYIINKDDFKLETLEIILHNVVFILKYLFNSEYNLVHNSLKCNNVYIDFSSDIIIKIMDLSD